MSFFKKNKKKKININIKTVSGSTIIRKIIYDAGCNSPEDIAELMGLNRVSDDVAEMEIEASDRRMERLGPILPIIESHALISAQVSAMSYVHSTMALGEEMPEKETVDILVHMFRSVSFLAAVSCMSAMLDLNIISEEY